MAERALRRSRAAVALTFALTGLVFGAWMPRLPDVKHALDASPASLGVALLAPAVGALLMMAPVGRLCAHVSSGRVTAIAFTLYCVLAAVVPLSGSVPALAALMLPWGAAVGAGDVAMNAQGVTVERAYARPILSSFHAWFNIGGFCGAGIGSLSAALGIAVFPQQIVVALGAASAQLAMSRFYLADQPARRAQQPIDRRVGDECRIDERRPAAPGRSRRAVLMMLGVGAIGALICEGAVSDWSAILLREELGASAGVAGLGFLAFSATMAAGRFAGDGVVLRLGRDRSVAILGAIGSIGLALGLAIGTAASSIAGFAMIGAGLAVMFPVAISSAADAADHPGAGIATVTTMGYTAFLAGPTLIGQLGEHLGLREAMWTLPVLAAAATVLIARACASTRSGPAGDASASNRAGAARARREP